MKSALVRGKLDEYVKASVWSKSVPPETKALASAAHATAHRARTTVVKDRGKAYGDMIATCASCHDKLGISPK